MQHCGKNQFKSNIERELRDPPMGVIDKEAVPCLAHTYLYILKIDDIVQITNRYQAHKVRAHCNVMKRFLLHKVRSYRPP